MNELEYIFVKYFTGHIILNEKCFPTMPFLSVVFSNPVPSTSSVVLQLFLEKMSNWVPSR